MLTLAAHALLTPFLRHLTQLTRTHFLCTVLINHATPLRRSATFTADDSTASLNAQLPGSSPYDPAFQHEATRRALLLEDNPSIFASNAVKPALSKTFAYFADLHLLVTKIPACQQDSKCSSRKLVIAERPAGKIAHVCALEVLADRWGGRVGRWAPIRLAVDGELESGV